MKVQTVLTLYILFVTILKGSTSPLLFGVFELLGSLLLRFGALSEYDKGDLDTGTVTL